VLLKLDGMDGFTTAGVMAAWLDGTEVVERDVDFEVAFVRERGAEAAAVRRDGDAARTIGEIGQMVREELRKGFEGA
jgi:hypothetical protein